MSKYSSKQTLVYKSVGEIDFCVDCHLPDETKFSHVASVTRHILKSAALGFGSRGEVQQEVDSSLPVLLFFHGGGLSVGVRSLEKMASPWLLKDALDAGFAVISADYSLFHPGNGYDIVSDVKDCLEFIATRLNKILARTTSQQVNPERIVVAGVSAGGYVAYLAALHGNPRPKALLPIYAMGGDYLLDHYMLPKTEPFLAGAPLLPSSNIDVYSSFVNVPKSSDPVLSIPFFPPSEPRLSYFQWQLQTGTFLDTLSGKSGVAEKLARLPYQERASNVPLDLVPLIPSLALIKSTVPPTFFVHGNADDAVPLEESRHMETLLKAAGVECQFYEHEGGVHAFEIETENSSEIPELARIVPFLLAKVTK